MPTSLPAPVSPYSKANSGTLRGALRRSQAVVGKCLWCLAKLGGCSKGFAAACLAVMSCIANSCSFNLHYTGAVHVRPARVELVRMHSLKMAERGTPERQRFAI